MKTLFVIRHAKSSWAELGMRDIERPLDIRGLNDAPYMAKMLKGTGIQPDLIVSSPAVRTQATALYFSKEFNIPLDQIDIKQEIYEAGEIDILNIIRNLPQVAKNVLLFGHNPTLTYFTNRFNSQPISNMPTCGIIKIDINTENWFGFNDKTAKVTGFWYPKMQYKNE